MVKTVANKVLNDYINRLALTMLLLVLFMYQLPCYAATESTQAISDLRVIVDISGSMKKTDPNNLRRPAVRLLAGLLPAESRAGIWYFGQQVNMAVKIGKVNEVWRELAKKQSNNINSSGLYTNIESAMRKASFDWRKPDPRYIRNLILLTDGHVDVSRDERLDKQSRARIIKEVLPDLEKAQVRIHTIALSDDVDEELLTTLSSYTDGLYKKVSSADDLQKMFLLMLEQSVKLDTIPLENNIFTVDPSINDMTLLVFNNNENKPTQVVNSDNKTLDINSKPENIKWHHDQGFDLITINKPKQGLWKIIAPLDKSNRVVIATNLKLNINKLPGFVMLGDEISVEAQLNQDGKPLEDKRLLSKFQFSLKRSITGSEDLIYNMTKSEKNENVFQYKLAQIFKTSDHELIIQAVSPTTKREIRHNFKVYSTPAEINISHKEHKYNINVIPYANLLNPESITIDVELNDKTSHKLSNINDVWVLEVDEKYQGSMFTLNLNAIRADSKPISVSFSKVLEAANTMQKLNLAENNPVAVKEVEEIVKKEPEKVVKKAPDIKEVVDIESEDEVNWASIMIYVVLGNIILFGLAAAAYIFIKRSKKAK